MRKGSRIPPACEKSVSDKGVREAIGTLLGKGLTVCLRSQGKTGILRWEESTECPGRHSPTFVKFSRGHKPHLIVHSGEFVRILNHAGQRQLLNSHPAEYSDRRHADERNAVLTMKGHYDGIEPRYERQLNPQLGVNRDSATALDS